MYSLTPIAACGPDPAAKHFCNAPGLCGAAAGRVGGLGVEDLADRADARFAEMGREARQEILGGVRLFGMDLQPGVDERADQPGPDRALMVGRIARAQVAIILGLVVRAPRCERTQAE